MELKDIKKALKEALSDSRFKHSKETAHTAQCLAMRYEADLDKAYLAGLLHDCTHCIPTNEQIKLCDKYGIELSEDEKSIGGSLIHQKLGAYFTEHIYGIADSEIINAIRYHTTGRPEMSLLEKIIFTADYIEPGRNKAPNLKFIRKMAFVDIDKAVYYICNDTINYLKESNQAVDSATLLTMKYYERNI